MHHPSLRPGERRQWLDTEVRSRNLAPPAGRRRPAAALQRRSTSAPSTASSTRSPPTASGSTIEELQLLVAGTEQLELYNVLDLLAGPQPAAGAALLADLIAEGRSTQYLLSILAGQLRDLLMAHALMLRGQRGAGALAAAMRIPAWRAERVLRTAQRHPRDAGDGAGCASCSASMRG